MNTNAEINAFRYARLLKNKLAHLKIERPKLIKKWNAEVAKWRTALAVWLRTEAVKRVAGVEVKQDGEYAYGRRRSYDIGRLFEGAPEPPVYPSDKQIKEIQKMIRFLAISEKDKVRIDPDDIEKLLGSAGDE